jgi:hypothetical protein
MGFDRCTINSFFAVFSSPDKNPSHPDSSPMSEKISSRSAPYQNHLENKFKAFLKVFKRLSPFTVANWSNGVLQRKDRPVPSSAVLF